MYSCKSTKEIVYEAPIIEERTLDTVVVTAKQDPVETNYELPVYNASATRMHDLIHTKLDIAFDWTKQHVLGKAELTLKPFFYETDMLVLDAKVFDFHKIDIKGKELKYEYDFQKVRIQLDRTYTRNEEFTINIEYTAKPNEGPSGGSAAITSDKGLFFINPLGTDKNKPQQIWTQGETENSSRWFPTIDKPNERCSQEIYLTVENRFKTLSNGKLISSTTNNDGTRTDYWKQDKPHAPYLFMVGVGEYAVVTDEWNGIPLMYYVEPDFKEDAELIFNHTPEMLQFFSDKLGYPYPWDKYAQIVCRDYVSGAMENTGAVVFGEFVQKHADELLDSNNDDIVAHEMFHHWFGDLVTCESWANLTLNEGFATYSEVLWKEHKYGHEAGEVKRLGDMSAYLGAIGRGGRHDLIDFEYNDKEEMFDSHSYSKGGLIVHMLRSYIGDDAFFASLNKYLTTNEYTDVEAHELRLAFEDTVGEDLNWFFNQWFFDQGHPELTIDYNIDSESKSVLFTVEQTQDPDDSPPVYQIPVKTRLYYKSGKVEEYDLWLDQRQQEFYINVESDEMPVAAVFDGTHDILAEINEAQSDQELFDLYFLSDEYVDKMRALKKLKGKTEFQEIYTDALKHPSHYIRSMGIAAVSAEDSPKLLETMAKNDKKSSIRALALKKLKNYDIAKSLVMSDPSFRVKKEAFNIIKNQDTEEALSIAEKLQKGNHKPLISSFAELYAATGDEKYLPFFKENLNEVSMFGFFNFINQYGKVAKKSSPQGIIETSTQLKALAEDENAMYFKKYSAANLIKQLIAELEGRKTSESDKSFDAPIEALNNDMYEIIKNTSDKRLKSAFSEYVSP